MTKLDLEMENRTLKEQIKKLEQEINNIKAMDLIEKGTLLDKLVENRDFRYYILCYVERKLEKYDLISPAIIKAIREMQEDIDILNFLGSKRVEKLLIGNLKDSITVIYTYMELWDSIDIADGLPGGRQALYFEGKFDKGEE